jgi:hypothetical protein
VAAVVVAVVVLVVVVVGSYLLFEGQSATQRAKTDQIPIKKQTNKKMKQKG